MFHPRPIEARRGRNSPRTPWEEECQFPATRQDAPPAPRWGGACLLPRQRRGVPSSPAAPGLSPRPPQRDGACLVHEYEEPDPHGPTTLVSRRLRACALLTYRSATCWRMTDPCMTWQQAPGYHDRLLPGSPVFVAASSPLLALAICRRRPSEESRPCRAVARAPAGRPASCEPLQVRVGIGARKASTKRARTPRLAGNRDGWRGERAGSEGGLGSDNAQSVASDHPKQQFRIVSCVLVRHFRWPRSA